MHPISNNSTGSGPLSAPAGICRSLQRWGLLCLLLCGGCYGNAPTAQVEIARRHLQLNRPQAAVEALAKEDSAEGHYLKAVALQALGQKDAARDQIGEALSIDADEPKYQGYDAVLEMLAGKREAAQKLIDMYEVRPSSPALAFFVTRAYVAKGDIKGTLKSFKLGLTLIDEVPEFMFYALQFAVTTEQTEIARQLLVKLEKQAPNDVEFLRELLNVAVKAKLLESAHHLLDRIATLSPQATDLEELRVKTELLLGQPEAALAAAQSALENAKDELAAEAVLAEALLRAEPKPERERQLAELAAKHPENPDFLQRYALYLVKVKRIPDAIAVINQGIARTRIPAVKASLLSLAVRIPVEAGDATLAEQQLNLHRSAFTSALVTDYFAGRIEYAKGNIPGAMELFQKVVASPHVHDSEADRLIAAESLAWQKRILSAEKASEKLKKAQEDLKKLQDSAKAKKK